jgi:hypothetical protein
MSASVVRPVHKDSRFKIRRRRVEELGSTGIRPRWVARPLNPNPSWSKKPGFNRAEVIRFRLLLHRAELGSLVIPTRVPRGKLLSGSEAASNFTPRCVRRRLKGTFLSPRGRFCHFFVVWVAGTDQYLGFCSSFVKFLFTYRFVCVWMALVIV